MIGHVLKLVWNRRRENGLLIAELLVSFLILCGLFTAGARTLLHWREPLGFDYHDVWQASISRGLYDQLDEEGRRALHASLVELERAVGDHPEVIAASLTGNVPYTNSRSITGRRIDGVQHRILVTVARPALIDVFGYELVEGRWYRPGDEDQAGNLRIITEDVARAYFGDEPATGKVMPSFDEEGNLEDVPEEEQVRVLGVVRDTKPDGEHRPAASQFFHLYDPGDIERFPPQRLLFRVTPGAGSALEADLAATAARVAPGLSVTLSRLESVRRAYLRQALTPLLLMGIVAGFLVTMVGLGLIGVLWQGVARRRNEIGLRRALGSTAGGTQVQILAELIAIASLAAIAGTAVFLQLPLLGVFEAGWPAVAMAIGCALAVVYGVVLVCGLYPSWLASRVQPAAALMYE